MDFRLLLKQKWENGGDFPIPSLDIDGVVWSLSDSFDIHQDTIPEYACVSYVWGSGRAENPIHPSISMSDRTLPVLSAAIRNTEFEAFWVDAFCVPTDPAHRGPTLESMGYIYSRAKQVVAVLAPRSFAAVKEMSTLQKGDIPSVRLLEDLERETWIRSVWTYQEVVNSSTTFFVGEDSADGKLLDCSEFLNALGYYQTKYREHANITTFDMRTRYPNLDAFEDLMVDWLLAAYTQRSALEIMANMPRRYYEDPKNYFYSMIGALTQKPSKRSKKPTVEALAETFMAIAEEKGDYSFIFASSPRDRRPGLEWRPKPELLQAIVHWHVDGEALIGAREPDGIRLKGMTIARRSTAAGSQAKQTVASWLQAPQLAESSDDAIAGAMRQVLKKCGFSGSGRHILTQHGFTFPQEELSDDADVEVWLTTDIYYVFGAPAFVVARTAEGTRYIPAVHAGEARGLVGKTDVFLPTGAARL
ncbi:hypothetical protein EIP91_009404 [Steccherinum ochraceum]|uniref:Heterokaryon incompatibility domain-containing protein n=1 Tax=Steccherinum ochraceum TaxID=92696 RepID=A0A4R0R736_9APHY|nr:hypothetical protein EIP91_009404 [Steccherinum ochraceum]